MNNLIEVHFSCVSVDVYIALSNPLLNAFLMTLYHKALSLNVVALFSVKG